MRALLIAICIAALLVALLLILWQLADGLLLRPRALSLVGTAQARDDGRYAQSPLKPWFDSLKSKKGFCCSDADGEATDYEIRGDAYWAPIDGVMTRVPDEAVITEPNKAGYAMKWLYVLDGGAKEFRCFIPAGGV